eukprot:m.4425 g.4425  ORF g.4425 m.4425 type:complete len:2676 (+) comp2418_c0_seq1:49-8076(+)
MAAPRGEGRTFLRNGDFISLYVEGTTSGYVSLESFAVNSLSIYPDANPPNFQQSCVFQVLHVASDSPLGSVVHFGEMIMLVHRGTQKVVARRGGQSDSGTFHVIVQDERSDARLFKPVPRFKLHSDGDPIRLNDQVVFESAQSIENRVYIHANRQSNNIEISPRKTTGIRVKLFAPFNVSDDAFRHVLKGGDFVRLFHQEANGFLVTIDTKHSGKGESFLTGQPTICLRQLPEDKNPEDYHDASSLWQVELQESDRRGGRPIQWNDNLRLKNVFTSEYLDFSTKTPSGALAPSPDRGAPSAVFNFIESTQNIEEVTIVPNEPIPYQAYFYICNDQQHWLHIDRSHETHEGGEEGTSIDFVEAVFVDTKRDEDAFVLTSVEQSDIREFYFAHSEMGTIKQLLGVDLESLTKTNPQFIAAQRSLAQLIRFCTKDDEDKPPAEWDGEPLTLHQNILGDLKIDDLLLKFVSQPFTGEQTNHWSSKYNAKTLPGLTGFNELAALAYRLLRQMCKENSHIGYVIARKHKDRITNQCRLLGQVADVNWNIADTLEEMFHDNELLLRAVDGSYIRTYVQMMRESFTFQDLRQYIVLLTSFCSHDGQPLPEAQDAIRHQLLDVNELIPETEVDASGIIFVTARIEKEGCPLPQWPLERLPLEEYVAIPSHAQYLEAVINLFSEICLDRRHESQHLLQQARFVPFPELMAVLRNAKLEPLIKAAYCHLCVHLYIDSDPLMERNKVLNREFDDMADSVETAKIVAIMDGLFPHKDLVEWIEQYLVQNEGKMLLLDAEHEFHTILHKRHRRLSKDEMHALQKAVDIEQSKNHLTLRVLQMIDAMAKWGYLYHPDVRHRIVEYLLGILWDSHAKSSSDYSEGTSHAVVAEAKQVVCDALVKMLDIELNDKVTELLMAFRDEFQHMKHKHLDTHAEGALRKLPMFHAKNDGIFKWFHRYDFSDENFVYLLMNLLEYDNEELRISALNLLTKTFNVKTNLVAMLGEVSIIVGKEETEFFHQLRDRVAELESEEHEELSHVAAHMTKTLNWLSTQCIRGEHQGHDSNSGTAWADDKAAAATNVVGTMQPLRLAESRNTARGVFFPWEVRDAILHPILAHQDMMRHENVHKVVITLLRNYLDAKDDEHIHAELSHPEFRQLFISGFRFLGFFCMHNHHNQHDLSSEEVFHFVVHSCKYGIQAEETLLHILEENHAVADEHLSHDMIYHLIENFFSFRHCQTGAYLKLLQKIVAPHGHGDRELQNFMMAKFFEFDNKDDILYMRNKRDLRGHFLQFIVDSFGPNAKLSEEDLELRSFFLEYIRFLALCADGNNTQTATRVQQEIPLEQALEPLCSSHNIPLDVKRYFIHFVREVYFPALDVEELAGNEFADEDTEVFDANELNRRLAAHCELAKVFCRDVERLTRQLRVNPKQTTQDIDSYMFSHALVFLNSFMKHSTRDFRLDQEGVREKIAEFTGLLNKLIVLVVDFITKRHELDESDPRFLLEHVSRLAASHALQDMLEIAVLDTYNPSVFTERLMRQLQTEQSWYHGDEERAALKAATALNRSHNSHAKHGSKGHRSRKHGSKGHRSGHKHSILSGAHRSRKHKSVATNRLVAMDAEEEKISESDRVKDELYNFIAQVTELFRKGHEPVQSAWLKELIEHGVDFDFKEFWDLVHIIRHELVQHKHAATEQQQSEELQKLEDEAQHRIDEQRKGHEQVGDNIELQELNAVHHHKKHLNDEFNFDIDGSLSKVFQHFRHHGADVEGHHHHHQLDEIVEEVLDSWLYVLCALLSHDEDNEQSSREVVLVAKKLNQLELPAMILFLITTKHLQTVNLSLHLGCLLLQTSPTETAIVEERLHPHSQAVFERGFKSHLGRRVLVSIRRRFEEHKEMLQKREHEQEDEKLARDQDEEDLESAIMHGLLNFVALMCDGVNTSTQNFFRHQDSIDHVNVVGLIVELSHSYGRIVQAKITHGFDFEDINRRSAVEERLKELHRERNDCYMLVQIYNTLGELISGPNRENQRELMNHKVCEPMLLFLMYMEYTQGTTIDDYTEQVKEALFSWMDFYSIEEHHESLVQKDDAVHPISAQVIKKLGDCFEIVDDLEGVDEDCETSVLQLLLGLIEGRKSGDEIYDVLCSYLFGGSRGGSAGEQDVIMYNLNKHFQAGQDDSDLEQEFEQQHAGDEARHFSDKEVAFYYFILLVILSEESPGYGTVLKNKLSAWEKSSGSRLRDNVGRIEIVRNGELETLHFPIPRVVSSTRSKAIVQDLEENIVNSTVLLNAQQKILNFLAEAEIVSSVIMRQAHYQSNFVLRMLSNETIVTYLAFFMAVLINIYEIFDLEDDISTAWPNLCGILNLVCGILMLIGFALNRLPIDRSRFDGVASDSVHTSALRRAVTATSFWLTESRVLYHVLYIVASILGLAISRGWFVFHLFDVVLRVQVMKLVIQAVGQNLPKLLATFLLAFLLLYALSVIGQATHGGEYVFSDGEIACGPDSSTLECLRDHLYYGFMGPPVFTSELPTLGSFVFSLVYFIAVVLVMTSIVAGIIIDSFGELRSTSEAIESEKQARCFICSFPRDVLEGASRQGFAGHVHNEHNPWAYVYFMIHITIKANQRRHLTGAEMYFLREHSLGHTVQLMPINRAACMEGAAHEADLEELKAVVDKLVVKSEQNDKQMAVMLDKLQSIARALRA